MTDSQLAQEANALLERLKTKMWQAAVAKQQQEYNRVERVYFKALNRYGRRYYTAQIHPDN